MSLDKWRKTDKFFNGRKVESLQKLHVVPEAYFHKTTADNITALETALDIKEVFEQFVITYTVEREDNKFNDPDGKGFILAYKIIDGTFLIYDRRVSKHPGAGQTYLYLIKITNGIKKNVTKVKPFSNFSKLEFSLMKTKIEEIYEENKKGADEMDD